MSLTQVEQHLSKCEEVASACVLTLPGTSHRPDSLTAVIEPTGVGWLRLKEEGKQKFDQRLGNALRPYFESVAVPQQWRYVHRMPVPAQGETIESVLEMLMAPNQGRVTEPEILHREAVEDRLVLRLRLVPDLIYFDGHFDIKPILAGVVQVDWAIRFAQEHFAISHGLLRMEALKFFRVISAGQEVTLTLLCNGDREGLQFSYGNEATTYSSGRIIFRGAA